MRYQIMIGRGPTLGGPGARGPFQRLKSLALAFGILCVIAGVLVAAFVIGLVLVGLILLGLVAVIGAWLVSRFLRRRVSSAISRTDPTASAVSSRRRE
jgi:membrane protein implicated in regulation of membrane protease activity